MIRSLMVAARQVVEFIRVERSAFGDFLARGGDFVPGIHKKSFHRGGAENAEVSL